MAEKLPRPTDYQAQSPAAASSKYATTTETGRNAQPYGTASWHESAHLRDVERNTNGRASREADLNYGTPAPKKAAAPAVAANELPTPEPYGNQTTPKGQGGITRV